jgi:hypothetical protein
VALIGALGLLAIPIAAEAAAPGAKLWDAATTGYASFQAVAASPDGTKVFVTGGSGSGYLTVAYDSGTGAVMWSKRFGSANADGGANSW